MPLLLLVRRGWAIRVQASPIAGALMWFITAVRIGELRRAISAPSTRMLLILATVAVFTALSALPLQRMFQNCENANS